MRQKHIYLVLAAIGFVVPDYFLVLFLRTHGLDGEAFIHQLFGTPVSAAFAADLIIASVVFARFVRREANRYSIERWWLYLVALLAAGLSFALPLFLFVRESRREKMRSAGALHQEHS